ncbi:hypothetical protein [Sphingomonas sp. BK069]|uniref:hypothetical protein n=1 Tax=Sphingomonas sp. BK069 TaxID=2586979 RepID=UPI001610377E|nr:hypothetical protein [Sphingomonas sp. BK069]MBB3348346.1 hypothetical protein [Sphingomonas sp. BK069]
MTASTTPSDWMVGVCLPLSEGEYSLHSSNPGSFDLVHQIDGGWPVYQRALLTTILEALNYYKNLGVLIEPSFTLNKFNRLSHHIGANKVFTLVGHWTEIGVELADGITPFDTIVDIIPPTYCGVVDLCVCHPTPLAAALRLRRPSIRTIRFVDAPVSLLLWLRLYKALFALLSQTSLDVDDAMQAWIGAAIDGAKNLGRRP